MDKKNIIESEGGFKPRFLSFVSYLGILCLVPLILNRDDEYVAFHARQGLVLWIWGVLAIFGLYVPVLGPMFFSVSALLIILFSIIGLLSVSLTKAWKIPVIGDWAEAL
ncbi:MAG TPA: hypothetical protein ENI77_12330 [Nitrospirae bacterium]|nr:hypothetical protein [Nitrospirota bacterium]